MEGIDNIYFDLVGCFSVWIYVPILGDTQVIVNEGIQNDTRTGIFLKIPIIYI